MFHGVLLAAWVSLAQSGMPYPYLQSHYFDLRPLMSEVKQGYALFIASGSFSGQETVTVFAPEGGQFEGEKSETVLTAFERRGEWFQPQAERVRCALSGPPEAGAYRFQVAQPDGGSSAEYVAQYDGKLLQPPTNIEVFTLRNGQRELKWKGPRGASSYLVFLVPEKSEDVLKDLIGISHPNHPTSTLLLSKGVVPPGKYWVAIRANEHLPAGRPGYSREAWGLSKMAYQFD